MSVTFDDTEAPRLTRAVQWIIALNVAIYFLQLTVVGPQHMLPALGFQSHDLARSWWTVGTYMFVHAGFMHLAFNMYTLWLFGPRVEHHWGTSEFSKFYIVSGLGGWLFHLVFAGDSLLVGASAAVLGVTLAYATAWPDDEILLFGVVPLKVKWLVILLGAMNIIGGIVQQRSGVAYLAHLGGLAAAWVYIRTASSSINMDRFRQRVSSIPDIPDETPRAIPRALPPVRSRRRDIDAELLAGPSYTARSVAEAPLPDKSPARRAKELDAVLDKISEHGIDSLTSDERLVLEEMSRKLRRD
jgi:membrane associated rhomboid family serine protease